MLKVNLTDDEENKQENGDRQNQGSDNDQKTEEFSFDLNEEEIKSDDSTEKIETSESDDKTEEIDLSQIADTDESEIKMPAPPVDTNVSIEDSIGEKPVPPEAGIEKQSLPAEPISVPPEMDANEDDESEEDSYYEADFGGGGGKKKWFIIGGAVVVIVVIFLFFNPFSGSGDAEKVEQQIDPVQQQMELKRQAEAKFLGNVLARMSSQMKPVFSFYDQLPVKAKLALLYIYGNEIRIELFTPDRTPIAELRKNLKNAGLFDKIQFDKVYALRPNMDVFSNYTISSGGQEAQPVEGASFLSVDELSAQVKSMAQELGISLKTSSAESTIESNAEFVVKRVSFSIKGKEANLIKFLKALDQSQLNVNIGKLSVASISKNRLKKREMTGVLELDQYSMN